MKDLNDDTSRLTRAGLYALRQGADSDSINSLQQEVSRIWKEGPNYLESVFNEVKRKGLSVSLDSINVGSPLPGELCFHPTLRDLDEDGKSSASPNICLWTNGSIHWNSYASDAIHVKELELAPNDPNADAIEHINPQSPVNNETSQ